MVSLGVPFFENPDGSHCFQACLRMILKHFLHEETFSWKDLESISGRTPGKATWPMRSLLWLQERGFTVRDIELFDYKAFVAQGAEYLRAIAPATAEWSEANSNMEEEQRAAAAYLQVSLQEQRTPTLSDIEQCVDEGFVVMCEINGQTFGGEEGFEGHMVLVHGYNAGHLLVNDPDLGKDCVITRELFEEAWNYSSPAYRTLIAIKLEK